MAETYEDKILSLKEDRANAANSKVGLESVLFNNEAEDVFLQEYLWGDGTHPGIHNLIKMYYEEFYHELGRTWTTPILANYEQSTWEAQYADALDLDGDGAGGFYPPDSNGFGAQELNTSTLWLNDNGDQNQTSGGLLTPSLLSNLVNSIGTVASDNSDGRSSADAGISANDMDGPTYNGFIYFSALEARNAAKERAEEDRGTGLLGRRTQNTDENSNVVYDSSNVDPTTDKEILVDFEYSETENQDMFRYTIGYGGLDHPNYYDEPERFSFLNALDNFNTQLTPYLPVLDNLATALENILDGSNTLFNSTGMIDDITVGEDTDVRSLYDTINNHLLELENYYDALSEILADPTTGIFPNNDLEDIKTRAEEVIAEVETRRDVVFSGTTNNILGDTYSQKLLKWRYFWISQRIEKPVGTLVVKSSIDTAVASTITKIEVATEKLNIILGDPTEYIPKVNLSAAFQNNKLDLEGNTLQKRIGLVIIGPQHATHYKIYRRLTSEISFNNDPWNNEDYLYVAEYNTIDPKTGFISSIYYDIDNFNEGDSYTYRVVAVDNQDRGDGISLTQSIESNIFGAEISFTSMTNGVIELSNSNHGLTPGSLVVMTGIVPEGYYYITTVSENIIKINSDITTTISGSILPCKSTVFISG